MGTRASLNKAEEMNCEDTETHMWAIIHFHSREQLPPWALREMWFASAFHTQPDLLLLPLIFRESPVIPGREASRFWSSLFPPLQLLPIYCWRCTGQVP